MPTKSTSRISSGGSGSARPKSGSFAQDEHLVSQYPSTKDAISISFLS